MGFSLSSLGIGCQLRPTKHVCFCVLNLGMELVTLQCRHIVGVCEDLLEEAAGIYMVAVQEGTPSCMPMVPANYLLVGVHPHMTSAEEELLNLGPNLAPHQRELLDLLRQYHQVYAYSTMELGHSAMMEHWIDTGDTPPVQVPLGD